MASLLDAPVDAHTRHLFAGSGYTLGRFDCPPDAPRWTEVNWIGREPHVVMPRTVVRIAALGADETVATPHDLLVYDADTHYRRRTVAGGGDRCLFAVIGADLAAELDLVPRRAPVRRASATPTVFARLAHAEAALASTAADLAAVDECVLHALAVAVGAGDPPTDRPAHRAAVEEVKALLADGPRTLAELGAAVHWSPFALARMFRAHTGHTVSAYARQLRLRRSYPEAIRPGADLSRIAAEHGFASHSHYTREFRRTFGFPPTAARNR